MARSSYPVRCLLAIDQLFNVVLGGDPDETLSARSYRLKDRNLRWKISHKLINLLFFMQKEHCKQAFQTEITRTHLAAIYQTTRKLQDGKTGINGEREKEAENEGAG